jgi:iron complex outermembrane receptor protein
MQGLDLSVSGSGLSTKIYNVATAQIGTLDQQAPDAPKWSGNAMARYSWQLGPGAASVQWNSDYVGGRYHSVDNTPVVYVRSSIGHNARVSYSFDHLELSAYVNNLTNAVRETVAYDLTSTGGFASGGYMPPRWWGASVRYEFGAP